MLKPIALLALILMIVSCQNTKSEPPLSINYTGTKEGPVILNRPVDGLIFNNINPDTLGFFEQGDLEATLNLDGSEWIVVRNPDKPLFLRVFPGETYGVEMSDSAVYFTGDNAAGQRFIHEWDRPMFTFDESRKFEGDTTAAMLEQHMKDLKSPLDEKLEHLHASDSITEPFYQRLKQDLDYFYAKRTLRMALKYGYGGKDVPEDFQRLIDEIREEFPLDADPLPAYWMDYAEHWVIDYGIMQDVKEGRVTPDYLDSLYRWREQHRYVADLANRLLPESVKERFLGSYLFLATNRNNHDPQLVTLYQEYRKQYPESPFHPTLQPMVDEIIAFRQKAEAAAQEDYRILETEKYPTLKEIIAEYPDQPLYIDMWATWCGPCKREFAFNASVDSLLSVRGVKRVYISVDDPNTRPKWLKDIRGFELEGDHLLASEGFQNHFVDNYTERKGYMSIPQYLLVDGNGQILDVQAPAPSEQEALEQALSGPDFRKMEVKK